ncbi:hypothetical protein GYB22_06635 [bacterium]|nr:hypothetical protein [bacterium]
MKSLKSILLILTCFISTFGLAQDIIAFNTGENVIFRWKASTAMNLEGYVVEWQNGSEWSELGRVERVTSSSELSETLGPKHELFLSMVGVEDLNADFTASKYNDWVTNNQSFQLCNALSMVNIEFAEALATVFTTPSKVQAGKYKIRIKTVVSGTASSYLESDMNIPVKQELAIPEYSLNPGDQKSILKWSKSTVQDHYVMGMKVYRSTSLSGPFELLNAVGKIDMSASSDSAIYLDQYLENEKTYYYFIRAFNAFGIVGERSIIKKVIPKARISRECPSILSLEDKYGDIYLKRRNDSLNVAVYRSTKRNSGFTQVHPISERIDFTEDKFVDRNVDEGVMYYYFLLNKESGEFELCSDTLAYMIPDQTPPAPPMNLTGEVDDNGKVKLRWDANTEPDILGYDVSRYTGDSGTNNHQLSAKRILKTEFEDDLGNRSQRAYRYVVYAVDQAYNRSEASEEIRLRRPDDIPPEKPIFTYSNSEDQVIRLRWTQNFEEDFSHYNVYIKTPESESPEITKWSRNIYRDTIDAEGKVQVYITAVDLDGNESEPSNIFEFTLNSPNGMLLPTNGHAIDSARGIYISWEYEFNKDLRGFLIERQNEDGSWQLIKDLQGDGTTFLDRHASSKSAQNYRIRAYDAVWNESDSLEIQYKPD